MKKRTTYNSGKIIELLMADAEIVRRGATESELKAIRRRQQLVEKVNKATEKAIRENGVRPGDMTIEVGDDFPWDAARELGLIEDD